MIFQNPGFIRLYKALAVAVMLVAYPLVSYAVVGKVEFATTGVTAVGADGASRPLSKGSALETGDLIQTMGGRAQIRFSDGGFVSLQPNTEFRIDEYVYEGKTDGSEKGFFSLIKGGLRAITGAIGHVNKKNYQVNTAVATIGIRGTEFIAQLSETLQITCGEGICVLFNDAGEVVLYAGESGRAKDRKTAPESDPEKPNLPPEQYEPDPHFDFYSASEDRDVNGNPCSITGCAAPGSVLPNGGGYAAAFVDSGNGSGLGGPWVDTGFSAMFNGSGQLLSLSNTYYAFDKTSNAIVATSGSDGLIAWGRWMGSASLQSCGEGCFSTTSPMDGWSYVVGIPSPSLPSGTATYTMIGATLAASPTLGAGVFNGSLNVDFGSSQVQAMMDVKFAAGTADFTYAGTNYGYITPGSLFYGGATSSSGSLCGASGNGCSANFSGFFAGPNAARAGMAYQINTFNSDVITGAAAFTKSGPGTPIAGCGYC
jgi:hypothetical protein